MKTVIKIVENIVILANAMRFYLLISLMLAGIWNQLFQDTCKKRKPARVE